MVSASVKRNLIEKYSFYSSIQKKTLNLHLTEPVPTGWAGQKLIGIMLPLPQLGSCTSPRQGAWKDVFERYLRVIKLRKLDPSEDFATKRPRRVYYTRMLASQQGPATYIIYNTQRRGLAELLISMERQCEGLMTGISCRCFSHVFFVSIIESNINRWSRGKW